MAKQAKQERERVSDEAALKFLKQWAKDRDLKGKELDHAVQVGYAKRLMALARWTEEHVTRAKPKAAKKTGKAKTAAKKTAKKAA
jgi:hypothetical protein